MNALRGHSINDHVYQVSTPPMERRVYVALLAAIRMALPTFTLLPSVVTVPLVTTHPATELIALNALQAQSVLEA